LGRNINLKLPKKIAVTGGIASGKSTICHLFEELGAFVVSADKIVHQLLVPTTQLGKDVIALLGPDIVVDETLSRERIAQEVFRAPHLLRELEKRIHPEVQKVIEAQYKAASQTNTSLFVAEVPLLYEARLEPFYDKVIVVTCDEKSCRKRFGDDEEYLRRSQRLMPIEEKIKKADLVIENNGTLENLRKTIQFTYNDLKENI
jgi:dephospho-CoA kinase